jgi:hypothetical protein
MLYHYELQPQQARYDQNIRAAIALATGKYCFLLGNDDRPESDSTFERLASNLDHYGWPEIVITNYRELGTETIFRRVNATALIGSGPKIAASMFRNFSFVSGILLDRSRAQSHSTAQWDGSEMYQTFVGCRMIAEGGRLLGLSDIVIAKDIQLSGEQADSYALKPRVWPCPIVERSLPLVKLGQVAFHAVSPFINSAELDQFIRRIFQQLFVYTYPPWLIEYRRVQSWRYALGVALGMRPRNSMRGIPVGVVSRWYLRAIFGIVTFLGLTVPRFLFEQAKPKLYARAKRWRS